MEDPSRHPPRCLPVAHVRGAARGGWAHRPDGGARRSGVIAEAVRKLDDAGVGIADLVHPPSDARRRVHRAHRARRGGRGGRGRRAGAGERSPRQVRSCVRWPWPCPTRWCWRRRNLLRIPRAPDLLLSFTVQPIMFVLLFVYVFGGAISTPGYDYVDFLMPGIIVQTMSFGGFVTALGLAEDLKKGLIDRFRSLPIARSAVLAGRTLADVATNVISLVIMLVVGILVGFSFDNGVIEILAASGCCSSSATPSPGCSPTSACPHRRPSRRRPWASSRSSRSPSRRRPSYRPIRCPAGSSRSPTPTPSPRSWTRSGRSGWALRRAPTWMACRLVAGPDRRVRDAVGVALPARCYAVGARLPPAGHPPGSKVIVRVSSSYMEDEVNSAPTPARRSHHIAAAQPSRRRRSPSPSTPTPRAARSARSTRARSPRSSTGASRWSA